MNKFIGIEYGRGCLATAIDGGCALATKAVQKMFPNAEWSVVTAEPFNADECARDRFGENFKIQREIYNSTPIGRHILIGGDHSVNFGHFAAIADQFPAKDLCLVYIDAHFDIHNVESGKREASGAPHGSNVRALLGDGDSRWLSLQKKRPALKPENLFFLGARSYEPSEIKFVRDNNIFMRGPEQLKTEAEWAAAASEIRERIGDKPFICSFDFDAIAPKYFKEVLVPASNGISVSTAEFFLNEFKDAYSFEFVEYAPNGDEKSAEIVSALVGIAVNA